MKVWDRHRRSWCGWALILAVTVVPSAAKAADPSASEGCVDAATEGQALRDAGKFRAARERFVACSRPACPKIVLVDCVQWRLTLEAQTPSVVFLVKDSSGQDVTNTRVSIDGELLVDGLDGRAIEVDPGNHVFRFEAPGFEPTEKTVLVPEALKGTKVSAALVRVPPPQQAARPSVFNAPPPPAPRHIPLPSWILGGVGVLGLAGFTYFWVSGTEDGRGLRDTCAPNCSQAQIDQVATALHVAQGSLAVGVTALVGAGIFYLLNPRPRTARSSTTSISNLW